jgi:hypothetical protein
MVYVKVEFTPPVEKGFKLPDSEVQRAAAMFLSLPDVDEEWSQEDELVDDELEDLLEALKVGRGSRGLKRLLKAAGLTSDQIDQLL